MYLTCPLPFFLLSFFLPTTNDLLMGRELDGALGSKRRGGAVVMRARGAERRGCGFGVEGLAVHQLTLVSQMTWDLESQFARGAQAVFSSVG